MQDRESVYAMAVTDVGQYILAVAAVRELRAITAGIMSIFIPVSVVVAVIGSLLGGIWTDRVSRPLAQLAKAAHAIARGNYSQVPRLKGNDEITELALALESMSEQILAGEQAQREFLQNASHELKTPLMNIQGYTEALRDGVYSTDQLDYCLDLIGRETQKVRKLVDDMLYLSTVTARSDRLNSEEIRLRDLMQAIEESTIGIAAEARVSLIVKAEPGDVTLVGDFDKLVRAVCNLIVNAARYAREQVRVTAYKDEEVLCLEVRDDGPGVDLALGAKAFERFTRGTGGQTGLGLAIVKAIVEGHNGEVTVHNDYGAVFTIRLPRKA
jgi:signal transduction histidine kinase